MLTTVYLHESSRNSKTSPQFWFCIISHHMNALEAQAIFSQDNCARHSRLIFNHIKNTYTNMDSLSIMFVG
eukprot:CCRYP_011914-RD/>CCRYP_011914-RD protein AED:0.47 eAED:0.47 QI:110/1/0.5/1/0/0/2/0/70